MIIIIICIIIIILFVIIIYTRSPSKYEVDWSKLDITKSDRLENNCFIILSNLSLMNHNKKILIPTYFNNHEVIMNHTQILGIKFTVGNYIWLAFAGTYLSPSIINAFDIRYTTHKLGFTIHKGFYKVYKKYIYGLLENIMLDTKKIIITGYSLGGVLAILLLCDLLDIDDRIIKCITFGTPKFGCKKMHNYFAKYNKLSRIEYTNDMIPKFAARDFYNIGIKKKFNLDNNISGIINNHYKSYLEYYVS
jgi:hypothetical protein